MLGLGRSSFSSTSAAAIAMPKAPFPSKYDVFLSFRGQDTRDNFTSHLYAELERKNIQTFTDYRLHRGDEISPELFKAIEESMIYIIIFSQHYASSTWCLDELAKILECKKRYGRDVVPVFYKVDPSSVRHQKGSYADAFVKHEKRFKDEVTQRWKNALKEAAGISGWDSNTTRPESMLVDGIVKDILRKLDRSFSSDNEGMVGIDKHIGQIQSLLHLEFAAIRIIGIWGMGGIGKSTLARALHNKLATQFSSRSCIINAEQEIERVGIDSLRKKYLSELLEEDISSNGLHFAIERLKQTKVLLILDDVKNSSQVQELIGERQNFGEGSRIIVTSRDMQVLKNAETDEIYEVKEMNSQDSLQLFSLKAFKQNHPVEVNADLVEKVLQYAKGIPLALKVLGSLLYGKTRKAWKSELKKLQKFPDVQIFNVLKLSYDGLDDEQKDIFLDIACFYAGDCVDEVVQMLDGCGFFADIGVDVLKDRCLVSTFKGRIIVHDLMVEMAREIVRQQCVNDPGKRSRLWKHEEIDYVLRKNKGTGAIQCIFLDMCQIKKIQLHPYFFQSTPNLRMLYFHKYFSFSGSQSNLIHPAFLESLPDSLNVLHWDGFPQRSLPLVFCPQNLVELWMQDNHLEQLWGDDQELPNLKRLDLSFSRILIRIPDLSKSPKIEEIILCGCESLVQVYSSSFLTKLKLLYLNGCVELRRLNLPSNILSGSSGLVGLYNCSKLKMFSINRTEVVESSGHSHFDGFSRAIITSGYQKRKGIGREKYLLDLELFRKVPPSRFSRDCWLDLDSCESLTSLPIDLCKWKLLRKLYLSGCSNLAKFPELEERMENLTVLVLDETAIEELPSSLHYLVGLEVLSLRFCSRLKIVPCSIGRLSKLCKLDLTYCASLESFPSSIFKLKLTELDLSGCSKLKTFPEILEPAKSFVCINLTETLIKELPSSLDCLVGLQTLTLNQCSHLESLPNSIGNLTLLSELDCSGCGNLTEIPDDICCLSSLRKLSLVDTGIVNLSEGIARISSLELLDVSYCRKLECIPRLPPFLKQLLALDCPSIRRMMLNSRLNLPSNSKNCTFELYLTNKEEQDPSAHSDVVVDTMLRIIEDAYSLLFYCFPGSAVPNWFPFRCEGNSVTVDKDSINQCNDSMLIGFAVCVVFRLENMKDVRSFNKFRCRLRSEFDSFTTTHTLPYQDLLNKSFNHLKRDHTFLWKYCLSDQQSFAQKFTFEFSYLNTEFIHQRPDFLKECGICPIYTKL